MSGGGVTLLILEDEPFIMLDLEMAAEDAGCTVLSSANCRSALSHIEKNKIDIAVLDVSLGAGETCLPVAHELAQRGIPFLLHTGDLVGDDGKVRGIDAPVVVKPTVANEVIETALALLENGSRADRSYAAE